MSEVVAVLLAAGESRRMGQPKALLPWQGTTLLEHQIAALQAAGIDRIVLVLGHGAERLKPLAVGKKQVTCVVNSDYWQGKTTSIKAGLRDLESQRPTALVLLNVDQPRSAETISHLLLQHQPGDFHVTVPTYQGRGGHPIILDPSLLEELRSINEETLGLKAVVQRHHETTRRVAVGTPEVLLDLNTPEQYQAALSAKNQDPASAGS